MAKLIKFVIISALTSIASAVLLILVLPKTPIGQKLIDEIARPQLERIVRSQLGSEIEFAQIRGSLPNEIVVDDIRLLAPNGDTWFTADRLHIGWSPLSLLTRHIDIQYTDIQKPTLHMRPPPIDRAAASPTGREDRQLPTITLDQLSITAATIHEKIFGTRYVMDLTGDMMISDGMVVATANLNSEGQTDLGNIRINLGRDDLVLYADLLSQPNGLISTLVGSNGPIWMSLNGEGPLGAWTGDLDGDLGEFGRVGGQMVGDLRGRTSLKLDLAAEPGVAIPEIVHRVGGDRLDVSATITRPDKKLSVELANLSGRFGEIHGTVIAVPGMWDKFDADITGTVTEAVLGDFGLADFGGPISLDTTFSDAGDRWTIDGTAAINEMRLAVSGGAIRPDTSFSGRMRIDTHAIPINLGPLQSLTETHNTIEADVSYAARKSLSLNRLTVDASGADQSLLSASGDVAIRLANPAIEANMSAQIAPTLLAGLVPNFQADQPLSFDASVSGDIDALTLDLQSSAPQFALGETSYPPANLTMALSGLPSRPVGRAEINSPDEDFLATAAFASTDTELVVETFETKAAGITATGSGRIDLDSLRTIAELELSASDATTPFNTVPVSGNLAATFLYDGNGGQLRAEINSNDLTQEDFSVSGVSAIVTGIPANLRFDVSVTNADLPPVFLAGVTSVGRYALDETGSTLRIESFNAAVGDATPDEQIELKAPATIRLGESIAVDQIAFDWLNQGEVSVRGLYSPTRIVAEFSANDVTVPNTSLLFTGDISVDTEQNEWATASISTIAKNSDGDRFEIAADGAWANNSAALTGAFRPAEDGADPIANFRLEIPAQLSRSQDTIRIRLPDSKIVGELQIDGPIDPIYAFIPNARSFVTGKLRSNVDIGGTLRSPTADGKVYLDGVRVEDREVGLSLEDLSGEIDLALADNRTRATLDIKGTGADRREDSVSLNGRVDLSTDLSGSADLSVIVTKAQVIKSPTLDVVSSADLRLNGDIGDLKLSGLIDVARMNALIPTLPESESSKTYVPVTVVRRDARAEPTETEDTAPPPNYDIDLDIEVRARDDLAIRGRGIDSTVGERSTDHGDIIRTTDIRQCQKPRRYP